MNVMSTIQELRVPDIGDFQDVPVIEVLIKTGDIVTKEATLLVLETDKATLDVPSSLDGVVRELKLRVGDKVNKGSLIAVLEVMPGAELPPVPTPEIKSSVTLTEFPVGTQHTQAIQPENPGRGIEARHSVRASPSLRRIARELGVDLSLVPPSLPNGRLQREDVERFVREELTRSATQPQNSTARI